MNAIIENMETLLYEADKVKGWQWVHNEPLWVTWPLEKFGMSHSWLPLAVTDTSSQLLIFQPSLHHTTAPFTCIQSSSTPSEAILFHLRPPETPFRFGHNSPSSKTTAGMPDGRTSVQSKWN